MNAYAAKRTRPQITTPDGEPIATWPQVQRIWSFCQIYGTANIGWMEYARKGRLSMREASEILAHLKNQNHHDAALLIMRHIPTFALKNTPSAPPEPTPGTYTEPTPPPAPADLGSLTGKLQNLLNTITEIEAEKTALAQERADLKKDRDALQKQLDALTKRQTYDIQGDDYVKPTTFDELLHLIKNGEQLFIYGGEGSGKSRFAEEAAKCLSLEFFPFSCAGGQRYSQIYGGKDIDQGTSKYSVSALLDAFTRPTLILLDEANSLQGEIANGLNGLLERHSGQIMTPSGILKRHPDCRIIAAANTNGRAISRNYTGASRNDNSFLARFSVTVHFDYDETVERRLLDRAPITPETAAQVSETFKSLRQKVREAALEFDVSTRTLNAIIRLLTLGVTPANAFTYAVYSRMTPAEKMKLNIE